MGANSKYIDDIIDEIDALMTSSSSDSLKARIYSKDPETAKIAFVKTIEEIVTPEYLSNTFGAGTYQIQYQFYKDLKINKDCPPKSHTITIAESPAGLAASHAAPFAPPGYAASSGNSELMSLVMTQLFTTINKMQETITAIANRPVESNDTFTKFLLEERKQQEKKNMELLQYMQETPEEEPAMSMQDNIIAQIVEQATLLLTPLVSKKHLQENQDLSEYLSDPENIENVYNALEAAHGKEVAEKIKKKFDLGE
jgi:hypothetical protein